MNKKIKLGLVGLNFGGYVAEREIFVGEGSDYVKIQGVCDLDHSKAQAFANKHKLSVYNDFKAMLADPAIEAIGLFTPPSGRAQLIHQCIAAKKHVMTTKPFELNSKAALKVLNEANEAGIAVHLNSPCPVMVADIAKISAWHKQYDLGQPIAARWETYGHYNEDADGSWFDCPEKCPVAPIFRLGIYGINDMITLMGPVESVQVTQSKINTGRPTPDNGELNMKFANGAIGSVFASLCINDGHSYSARLVMHYERGTIFKEQTKEPGITRNINFKGVNLRLNCVSDGRYVEELFSIPPEIRSGAYQWDIFYDVVRNGVPLTKALPPETTAMAIAVLEAMTQAAKGGKNHKINLKKQVKKTEYSLY